MFISYMAKNIFILTLLGIPALIFTHFSVISINNQYPWLIYENIKIKNMDIFVKKYLKNRGKHWKTQKRMLSVRKGWNLEYESL